MINLFKFLRKKNCKNKRNKREKGIGMITLVITIILVIIMAGLAIYGNSMTISEAGVMSYRHELKDIEVSVSATRINNQKEGIGEEIKETGFYPIIIENPPEDFVSFGTDEFYGYIVDLNNIDNEETKRGYDYKKYVNAMAGQTITFGESGKDNDVYIYDATGKVFYAKGLYTEGGVYFSDILTEIGPELEVGKIYKVDTNTVEIKIVVTPAEDNPDGNIIVRVNDSIITPNGDGTYNYTATSNGTYVITATDDKDRVTKKRVSVTEIIEGEYEITYHFRDEVTPNETVIKYGSEPIRLKTAKREGYALMGWAKTAGATEPDYRPGVLFKENVDVNLYALWKEGDPREFDITFNANGGKLPEGVETSYIKVEKTNFVIPTFEPTNENNIFLGWAEESTATEATYMPGDEITEERDITLFAVWERGEIRVDIEVSPVGAGTAVGGGVKEENSIVYVTASANPGYAFFKWTVESNNVKLDNNYAETTRFIMPKGAVKLKAVFKETEYDYTIKYDANNGAGTPNTQYKKHDEDITLSTMIPTRSAHIFEGWADTINATIVKYRPGDPYRENKSTTLYAVWRKNTDEVTLKFNANGGTNPPNNIVTIKDSIIRIPTDTPIRSNLIFLGWSEDNRATEPTYRKNDYYTLKENKTFYAVWSDSEKPVVNITAEEKDGYLVLTGNAVDNGGILSYAWTNQFYSETEQSAISWINLNSSVSEIAITKDVIKAGIHCFYVKDENGNVSQASIDVFKMTFMSEGAVVDTRYKASGYGASLTTVIPEKAMYVFAKWKSDTDGRIYEEGEKYLLNKEEIFVATWDEAFAYIPSTNKYYRTLQDAVDATKENATDYIRIEAVRNEVAKGVEIKNGRRISLSTSTQTYTAQQTAITIGTGCRFKLLDGTIVSNDYGIRNNGTFEFDKGKITAPNGIYNSGHIIYGLENEAFSENSVVVESTNASYQIATGGTMFWASGSFIDGKTNYEVPLTGVTLRPSFEIRKINNTSNVITTIVEDLVMTSEVTAGTNARPVEVRVTLSCINNSYTFQYSTNNANWTTGKTVTLIDNATVYGRILRGSEVMNTEQITINNIVDLVVSFDGRGIYTNPASKTVKYKRTYGSSVNDLPDTQAYYFRGWYTSASGGTKITSSSIVTATADHTLYARWEGKPFTVTFNPNGGSVSTTTKTVYYDSTYGTMPTPTRQYHDFLGWYTSASGGSVRNSSTIVNTASNHTLYAHWEKWYRYCDCCGSNYYDCFCESARCKECNKCSRHCPGHVYCDCCGIADYKCSCYGSLCSVCNKCSYHCGGHTYCGCCGAVDNSCSCYGSLCSVCGYCSRHCGGHTYCGCCGAADNSCSCYGDCPNCSKCTRHCSGHTRCNCCNALDNNCACSSSYCGNCNKCSRHCTGHTNCSCCGAVDNNCSCNSSYCSTCGKCSNHCAGHQQYSYCSCCGGNWYTCPCNTSTCSICSKCSNHCSGHTRCSCCGATSCSCSSNFCGTCGKCTSHCGGHTSYSECYCCGGNWNTCSCNSSACGTCGRCSKHCSGHTTCSCCGATSCSCSSNFCGTCGKCSVHCGGHQQYSYCSCCGGNYYTCSCSGSCSYCSKCSVHCGGHTTCSCCGKVSCSCYGSCSYCSKCSVHCGGHTTCSCCGAVNCTSCSGSCSYCSKCSRHCGGHPTCSCCGAVNCSSCSGSCSQCDKCLRHCGGHTCSKCGGSGGSWKDCPYCTDGTIPTTSVSYSNCSYCGGSGSVSYGCPSDSTPSYPYGPGLPQYDGCGGDGYFVRWCRTCWGAGINNGCSSCGGSGYATPPTQMCTRCGGSGTVTESCQGCGGSGKIRNETTTRRDCSCDGGSIWEDCPGC